MALSTVLINGFVADRTSTVISIDGQDIWSDQITKVDYGNTIARQGIHGGSMQKLGDTRGKLTSELEFSMYYAGAIDLIRYLTQTYPGRGYMEVPWQMQLDYRNIGGQFVRDIVQGCKLKTFKTETGEGESAAMVSMPCDCMMVLFNGVPPIGVDQFKR
jgi:hypothetical protein